MKTPQAENRTTLANEVCATYEKFMTAYEQQQMNEKIKLQKEFAALKEKVLNGILNNTQATDEIQIKFKGFNKSVVNQLVAELNEQGIGAKILTGIDEYPYPISTIEGVEIDARSIKALIAQKNEYQVNNMHRLFNTRDTTSTENNVEPQNRVIYK